MTDTFPLGLRTKVVRPSPTLAIAARAAQLRREGRDIASLSVGEPDFPVPAHVAQAMTEAIQKGQTRYTASSGMPELREAIAERTKAETGLSYPINQIQVCAGAKQALFNACLSLLDEGDQAVIPNPYWVSYPDMVKLADGTPVDLPLSADDGWQPSAARLSAVMNERTKVVMLGSPSNPTGAVWSEDSLRAIADVLRRHPRAVALCDDIYGRIVFGKGATGRAVTLLQVAPDLRERTLIVDGCSKTYAMTGLRLGWALGPVPLIAAMNKVQDSSTSNPNSIAQHGAIAALRGPQAPVEEMIRAFERRRDQMCALLAKGDVNTVKPGGAFYVFADVTPWLGKRLVAPARDEAGGPASSGAAAAGRPAEQARRGDAQGLSIDGTVRLAEVLLEEFGVATVPGAAFGTEGYLRLSFATSDQEIAKGVERLHQGLAALQ
jgi:aspartate aminotransferase